MQGSTPASSPRPRILSKCILRRVLPVHDPLISNYLVNKVGVSKPVRDAKKYMMQCDYQLVQIMGLLLSSFSAHDSCPMIGCHVKVTKEIAWLFTFPGRTYVRNAKPLWKIKMWGGGNLSVLLSLTLWGLVLVGIQPVI